LGGGGTDVLAPGEDKKGSEGLNALLGGRNGREERMGGCLANERSLTLWGRPLRQRGENLPRKGLRMRKAEAYRILVV